jgi:hypothetical protein
MQIQRWWTSGVSALAAAILLTGLAQAGADQASEKLAKVAWIQGSWKTLHNGDYLDEYWSPPHADSMIGMFRWAKKDGLWMSEKLSIVTDGDNVVLRVKHFDRAMVGWEEKDKAITLPLVRQTDAESVFETADQTGETTEAVRLTYRKTGADAMDVILETRTKDKERRLEFHFERMK